MIIVIWELLGVLPVTKQSANQMSLKSPSNLSRPKWRNHFVTTLLMKILLHPIPVVTEEGESAGTQFFPPLNILGKCGRSHKLWEDNH